MASRLCVKVPSARPTSLQRHGLLIAGVDLPTVAGRLGHGGGDTTTLKGYAAWVAASDRKAAETLGSRMPKQRTLPSPTRHSRSEPRDGTVSPLTCVKSL